MITLIRILRFVVIGILIYVLYKLIWKGKSAGAGEMKQDPICGIFIPESQAIQYNWNKEIYYFCSEECKRKFQKLKQ
jgi:YHS domain-containing protein